jgi:hypothetical protein
MFIYPKEQLVMILMIQNDGFPDAEAKKHIGPAFEQAALKAFAPR